MSSGLRALNVALLLGAMFLPYQQRRPERKASLLLNPDAPELNRRAPDQFHVRLETTKGVMRLEIRRELAPYGVDRFYGFVRAGYYDEACFFRVVKGRWAQFGINEDPKISQV